MSKLKIDLKKPYPYPYRLNRFIGSPYIIVYWCITSFVALTSGAYERFCVLFNIGALLSQLAAMKGTGADEDLKVAAKYFQQSAGVYSYLKDQVYPVLQTVPTPDLSVSCLVALSAIMLAQAQDCIYKKASSGMVMVLSKTCRLSRFFLWGDWGSPCRSYPRLCLVLPINLSSPPPETHILLKCENQFILVCFYFDFAYCGRER